MTLATGVAVALMLRRTQDAGGFATVIARGGSKNGGILVQCASRGEPIGLKERQMGADFTYQWRKTGPESADKWQEYVALRRKSDPDLWVIELDIADVERFVVESLALN